MRASRRDGAPAGARVELCCVYVQFDRSASAQQRQAHEIPAQFAERLRIRRSLQNLLRDDRRSGCLPELQELAQPRDRQRLAVTQQVDPDSRVNEDHWPCAVARCERRNPAQSAHRRADPECLAACLARRILARLDPRPRVWYASIHLLMCILSRSVLDHKTSLPGLLFADVSRNFAALGVDVGNSHGRRSPGSATSSKAVVRYLRLGQFIELRQGRIYDLRWKPYPF